MTSAKDHLSLPTAMEALAGGGEMGALMRALDWAATPVGPIEDWPQSLRTVVGVCLASRFPMIIFWGPDFVQFYNDAYRPILGAAKHPAALGQRGRDCWPEIWDVIGPMLQGVLATGAATWSDDQLLLIDRYGYVEECYFTFSYSPIRDESGGVGGVFCAVTETTGRVLGERRLRTLRELGAQTVGAPGVEDACARAMAALAYNPADIPFALLYLLDAEGAHADLAGATGLAAGTPASPRRVELAENEGAAAAWPLARVARTGEIALVEHLAARFGPQAIQPDRLAPSAALVLPVAQAAQDRPAALLVAGVNPQRALDDDYRGFFDLVAGQIATAIADARAYEEERRRAEALAELDRAKTAFFSNVSHEFRTPLTLSLGPVEDVLGDPVESLSSHGRERLEIAHRNHLRLLRLVNTLLDFSRIEAGRVQASYEPTDLAALTTDLASVFRSAVERAGLRLVVDCPPLPEPVYVDREMWEKIVLNLLSNALKFTFDGTIAVTLRPATDGVALDVRDSGVGIPPEELPHLFERFHRVKNARARTHEGTGIGLALVRELARLHGGEVRAASTVGVGTTFTVSLPLGSAHLSADRLGAPRALDAMDVKAAPYVAEALRWLPGAADAKDQPHSGADAAIAALGHDADERDERGAGRARILLADDNADMRDYLSRLLGSDYAVRAVADGTTALAVAREWLPNLVLSDIMMPGLDGIALLKELRADPRTATAPVILLSARAGDEAAVEGLDAGADDYLVKPFAARELLARVRTHVELARLRARMEDALRQRTRQAELAAEVGAALTERATVPEQLQQCAAALVRHLDATFARIWTLDEAESVLVLRASAGLYTHLDGPHSRVPLGALKIGRIAAARRPHLTNNVIGDPEVSDQDWAQREGMVAFAGYPLVVADRLVGVMALFARHALTDATLDALGAVTNEIALGIARTWSDEERARLLGEAQAARAAAEAERQHLHDLFMQAPAIIAVLRGPRHVFEVANPPYLQIVGRHDRGEFLGRPVREALPEVEGQGYFELLDQIYATGTPFVGTEMPVKLDRRGDGILEEILVNFVYQPFRNAEGAVEGIMAHAVEVTEQVQARQRVEELARQVQAERDRLQQIVDLLPAAVVVTDAALTIQVSNRAVRALLGADAAASAPPVQAGAAVPADDQAAFAAYGARHLDGTPYRAAEIPLARAALRGEEVRGEQMLLRNAADGRDVPILVNAAPLRDASGAVTGGVVVFQDITNLRDLERAREEFLSSAAHDLKTPLTSIRGLAQLAQRRVARLAAPEMEAIAASLAQIEDGAKRMVRLIDELGDVTRVQMGGALELERRPADLVALARAVAVTQEGMAPERIHVQPSLPTLDGTVDAARIERVIGNLLSNAIKYSPDGGAITVQVAQEIGEAGAEAVIVVRDEGIGIPAADLPYIFERFRRAGNVAGHIHGTGIGLASARQIVEQHGGTISAQSREGHGSTFTVRLPLTMPRADAF